MKRILLFSLTLICVFVVEGQNQKKIGLVLSGGGALGYAHIGAIQALEEHGIYPEYISGSSMGAIIGVMYAGGYSPLEMLKVVQEEKMYKFNQLFTPKPGVVKLGLSSHATLRSLLHELMPHNSFDSLQKSYFACVTNLDDATWKAVGKGGHLAEYVVASAAIPGVFEAEIIDGTTYVDGGVLNNLPAQAIHDKVDVLIGVDVIPFYQDAVVVTTSDVLVRSLRAAQHANSMAGRKMCDFLVESPAIKYYNEFQFDRYREIYQYGYKAMNDYLNANPKVLKSFKR